MGQIYCTIDLTNGFLYVGKNDDNNESYYGSGITFMEMLSEKGKENFTKIIIDTYTTTEEHKIKEPYWIKKLGAYGPRGYNRTPNGGGVSRLGCKHTEETKKKIGSYHIGNQYCKDKKASINTKKKLVDKWATRRPKIDILSAEKLFIKGYTFKQLAELFNCSVPTIGRRFKEHGIQLPKRPPANKGVVMNEELRKKYQSYWNNKKNKS